MNTTKKKGGRVEEVDLLKGLSMLTVILLHTNAYFLSNPLSFFTWDWGQFAVPIFIFCSTYLFFYKQYTVNTFGDLCRYVYKRAVRLLIPYYGFAIVYTWLVFLHDPKKITFFYLTQVASLMGGVDINWLVLLFLYFSILMPFLSYTKNKRPVVWWIFCFFSLVSSIVFMYYRPSYNYRYVMFLPWSLLVIFTQIFVTNIHRKIFVVYSGLLSLVIFILLRLYQTQLGHSLIMFDNKYPPNLYHLSFGIFSITILFVFAKIGLFSFFPLKKLFSFLSKNSYSLYFIHWGVIFVLWVFIKYKFNWLSFFASVLSISVIIQVLLKLFMSLVKRYLFSTLNKGPTI